MRIILTTIKRIALIKIAKNNKDNKTIKGRTLTKKFKKEGQILQLMSFKKFKEMKHKILREDRKSSLSTKILILKFGKQSKNSINIAMKILTFSKGWESLINKEEKGTFNRIKIDTVILILGTIKTMIKEISILLVRINFMKISKNKTNVILIKINFIKKQEVDLAGVRETNFIINTIPNVLINLILITLIRTRNSKFISLIILNKPNLFEGAEVEVNNAITLLQIHIAICFSQSISEITKEETNILIMILLTCALLNSSLELLNERTSLILHAAKMFLSNSVEMAEDQLVVVKEVVIDKTFKVNLIKMIGNTIRIK